MPKSICELSLGPVLKVFERNCAIIGNDLNFPKDLKESVLRDRNAMFRSFIKQYVRDCFMEENLRVIDIPNINSVTIPSAQHSTIGVQCAPISLSASEYCATITVGKILELVNMKINKQSMVPFMVKREEFQRKDKRLTILDIMRNPELFFNRIEIISMVYDEIVKAFGAGRLIAIHGMKDLYEGTTLDKNLLITTYYALSKAPDFSVSEDTVWEEEQIQQLNFTFESPEPYEESHIRALAYKHIFEKIEDMYKRGYIATSFARDVTNERASNVYTVTFNKK